MKQSIKSALLASLIAISGCTSGGGDDDGGGNGGGSFQGFDNACSALGLNQRIINGTQCVSEQNSPVVRLAFTTSSGRALCTGTMLTDRFVLTAAHCFLTRPTAVAVEIGNRSIPGVRVAVHPDYRAGPTSFGVDAGFNDVAVIELGQAAGVPTLPLLISRDIEDGTPVALYGFGLDEDENLGTLRGGTSTIDRVTRDHFTTRFNGSGSNTCEGDSGGPVLVNTSQGLAIIGVTSSGTVKTCGPGDTSIYANVQSGDIINFIQDAVPGVRIN